MGKIGKTLEKKKAKYNKNKLDKAIKEFFRAVDEDGSGFLEPHEFVVAQQVIAEMAGADFDEGASIQAMNDLKKLDKDGDCKISLKEFSEKVTELCEAIMEGRTPEEVILELGDRGAVIVSKQKRELTSVLRQLFTAADTDGSGYMDAEEIAEIGKMIAELSQDHMGKGWGQEMRSSGEFKDWEAVDAFLGDIKAYDKSANSGKKKASDAQEGDGKVEMSEFIEHFAEIVSLIKLPKSMVITRLKAMKGAAMEKKKT
eukprot:gnl/TRDRNA2_/TRDRNA2_41728_c0_seq1.p1 gnl/TRDRNA2_/TRDRNA2_41728_c0~~gnl/TRDRNA2_/TRDRNA2_41728_c0_seq1.p1  ORF type:complete len:257 (+),score=98.60 gnl/TRDRNA2_/TRDRNA2_41728_c0_seq1:81-851(+)